MSSLNKCTFIGNVGKDPEVKTMNGGDQVANFSLACTDKWTAKNGEKKEKTEWVNIVIFGKLCKVVENYVKKGSKLYVSGKLRTRSYEKDGQTKYMTEVVLDGFSSELIMLDSKGGGGERAAVAQNEGYQRNSSDNNDLDDQIPFIRW